MAHIGTLRDFKFKGEVDDIRGTQLFGRDNEKLGKVDDVVFDHAGGYIQYLVVDTGGWLKSSKFLVPADRVNTRSDGGDFTCDLTKSQVEAFPEYRDSIIRTQSDWDSYEKRYRETFQDSGGVLHKEGSDHLVTPEAAELPAIADDVSGVNYTPQRLVDKFTSAEPSSAKGRLRPAGMAARAEDASMPGNALSNEQAIWNEDAAPRNRRATDGLADENSAYGNPSQQRVPQPEPNDPPAYTERYAGNRRLRDFEESLRRNRVDITSSCRSCGVEKDDKAA